MATVYEYDFTTYNDNDISIQLTIATTLTTFTSYNGTVSAYEVTAASGTGFGSTITGIYGSPAYYSTNGGPDDVISPTNGTGVADSSVDGIDNAGIGLDLANGDTLFIANFGEFYGRRTNGHLGYIYSDLTLTNFSTSSTNCYCTDTAILTVSGPVAIQDIAIGDMLVTIRDGAVISRPVLWVGRRRIDVARHPNKAEILPIRIRAGAIAPGIPERDLRVSPEHGLFIDGALFEAKSLVNGLTIYQEAAIGELTYYHVELNEHDIILAEGCPAESYLDTGNRAAFENQPAPQMLHANFKPRGGKGFCVPVMREGAVLEAVQARLAARARNLTRHAA